LFCKNYFEHWLLVWRKLICIQRHHYLVCNSLKWLDVVVKINILNCPILFRIKHFVYKRKVVTPFVTLWFSQLWSPPVRLSFIFFLSNTNFVHQRDRERANLYPWNQQKDTTIIFFYLFLKEAVSRKVVIPKVILKHKVNKIFFTYVFFVIVISMDRSLIVLTFITLLVFGTPRYPLYVRVMTSAYVLCQPGF